MGRSDFVKHGDYNFQCDKCGFKRKASTGRLQWDNLFVCPECFDVKHPQEYVKGIPDDQTVPIARLDVVATMGTTTVKTAGSKNDTTIDLTSISGIADGDAIGIVLDNGSCHWTYSDGTPVVYSTGSSIFYPTTSTGDGLVSDVPAYYNSLDYNVIGGAYTILNERTWTIFKDITFPPGEIDDISSAYIKFTAYDSTGSGTIKAKLYFNDEDNPSYPVDYAATKALSLTTANTAWDLTGVTWTNGTTYNSPDIASGLKEVVGKPSFAYNNDVMFITVDDGSGTAGTTNILYWSTIDYLSGTERPELHVGWIYTAIRVTLGSYLPYSAAIGNTVYVPSINSETYVTATGITAAGL